MEKDTFQRSHNARRSFKRFIQFNVLGTASSVPAPSKPPAKGDMKIYFTLDHPEIVILENAMDVNTNALFMKVRKLKKVKDSQVPKLNEHFDTFVISV